MALPLPPAEAGTPDSPSLSLQCRPRILLPAVIVGRTLPGPKSAEGRKPFSAASETFAPSALHAGFPGALASAAGALPSAPLFAAAPLSTRSWPAGGAGTAMAENGRGPLPLSSWPGVSLPHAQILESIRRGHCHLA